MNEFPAPGSLPPASFFDSGVEIEGSKLVVPDGYVFPPVCPISGEVKGLEVAAARRVSAHEPWVYMLLLAGAIPYIIVAVATARKGTFSCRLSRRVIVRRRWGRIAGCLAFFASFYYFGKSIASHNVMWSFLAIAMAVAGFCAACGLFEGLKASKVKDGKLWLSGIPKRIREQVKDIEFRRSQAASKAAREQYAASLQAAANMQTASAQAPVMPPPIPLFQA